LVYTTTSNIVSGAINVDVANLAKGMYQIQIVLVDGKQMNSKFVKE